MISVAKTSGVVLGGWLLLGSGVSADEPETLETVEVIGVTPVHGLELPKNKISANVQTATDAAISETRSLDLTEFMNRRLNNVTLNAAQGNPLQPDLQYRGFTASPVLGLPQGLVVYQNGVRINEVFGDTVNWDLIPKSAIASINLMPGSNPLFGQNTLGGALSIRTKNGFTHPGYSLESYGGSFRRIYTSAEAGGKYRDFGYYANVSYFDEDGWRKASPSNALNFFGSVGWHTEKTSLDLNVSHGDTSLTGNGPLPVELLAEDRSTFFTRPDITRNNMQMVNLEGSHWFNDRIQLSGNAYYRKNNTYSFNSDAPFDPCDDDPSVLCQPVAAGLDNGGIASENTVRVRDRNGQAVPATFNATNNISRRQQQSYGGTLQTTLFYDVWGRENQLLYGVNYNQGLADFDSQIEFSQLTPARNTTRTGVFQDEVTKVSGRTRTWSLFVTDTFNATDKVALTFSGRFNSTRVSLGDQSGNAPRLNGAHNFDRFNPSVGFTYNAMPELAFYGGYSESSRAPTVVELACADPGDPCILPNASLADPPLKQVIARSFEGGMRGQLKHLGSIDIGKLNWQAGVFHTINQDDILFQTLAGATGTLGFFRNVGDTRRQGIEFNLSGQYGGKFDWFLSYNYIEATFQDGFISPSPHHPLAENGVIQVHPGNYIPGIPKHTLKVGLDYAVTQNLTIGGDVIYNAGQYFRGDEANLLGKTDAYAIVNLHGQYRINKHFAAFARIENVFDTNYETFGVLGNASEVLPGFNNPRFLGVGTPLSGWLGVKVSL